MRKNNVNKARDKKVFVAMSGGVDSSVAALLLKKQGYKIVGFFMRCFNLDGCAEKDAEDARRAAEHLGIPFYVFDLEEEYKKEVVDYMIEGYRQGITPNPDVMCNREIKFGLFLKMTLSMGADYVATGHYVHLKTIKNPVAYSLYQAKDTNKDQSYFLWTLTQDQLKYCLFPIGGYLKSEVREIARKAGLHNADKKDSQGICFLGKITLSDFLKQHIPEKRGVVLTTAGEKIGEHQGAHFYTIGQRHLGIKYQASSVRRQISCIKRDTKPRYVAAKDLESNTVIVAEGNDNPALYKKEADLINVNFTNPIYNILTHKSIVFVRVRYREPLTKATLWTKNYKLVFAKPVKFVAPGQSAVFYAEDRELIGGGVIT